MRRLAILPPLALVCVVLAGCQMTPEGVAPVSTTPPATAYAQIDAIRTALGGDWSPLDETLDASCTVEGGEPGAGRRSVVTTVSESSRSRQDVIAAGQLAADALTATGDTIEPYVPDGWRSIATGVDITGNRTTLTVEAQTAEIRREGLCVDA